MGRTSRAQTNSQNYLCILEIYGWLCSVVLYMCMLYEFYILLFIIQNLQYKYCICQQHYMHIYISYQSKLLKTNKIGISNFVCSGRNWNTNWEPDSSPYLTSWFERDYMKNTELLIGFELNGTFIAPWHICVTKIREIKCNMPMCGVFRVNH